MAIFYMQGEHSMTFVVIVEGDVERCGVRLRGIVTHDHHVGVPSWDSAVSQRVQIFTYSLLLSSLF